MMSTPRPDDSAAHQAIQQWTNQPCGADVPGKDPEMYSREDFDAVASNRYGVSDPWLNHAVPWADGADKDVLEIGHGLGTDLLRWSQNGATVSGVDLTPKHHRLAKRNLESHGVDADLRISDARELPFEDGSFDIVYSCGVLHHMTHPEKAVKEIHRVLRPGGKVVIAVYSRWSAFHLFGVIGYNGIRQGKLLRLGYKGTLSTLEKGADGKTIKPHIDLYTKGSLLRLFEPEFNVEGVEKWHLQPDHWGTWSVSPQRCRAWEPRLGWYLVLTATRA